MYSVIGNCLSFCGNKSIIFILAFLLGFINNGVLLIQPPVDSKGNQITEVPEEDSMKWWNDIVKKREDEEKAKKLEAAKSSTVPKKNAEIALKNTSFPEKMPAVVNSNLKPKVTTVTQGIPNDKKTLVHYTVEPTGRPSTKLDIFNVEPNINILPESVNAVGSKKDSFEGSKENQSNSTVQTTKEQCYGNVCTSVLLAAFTFHLYHYVNILNVP